VTIVIDVTFCYLGNASLTTDLVGYTWVSDSSTAVHLELDYDMILRMYLNSWARRPGFPLGGLILIFIPAGTEGTIK
jgi:hypothetical protein